MGGDDVLLGVQWLQSLGTIDFNFQELFLKFFWEGKEVELRGTEGKLGKIIKSNNMTKLLTKEQCRLSDLVADGIDQQSPTPIIRRVL